MILYNLDEHTPPAIADGLRRRGIDTSTTVEAWLRSATDEAHLAYALAQGRVLVTCDRDFLVLASRGRSHAGIAKTEMKGILLNIRSGANYYPGERDPLYRWWNDTVS